MTSILRRAASSCVTTSQRLIKSPVNVYCLKLLRASLTKLLSGRVASHTRSSPAHFNAANTKFTRGSISEQRVGLIGNSHLDCPDVELYSYTNTHIEGCLMGKQQCWHRQMQTQTRYQQFSTVFTSWFMSLLQQEAV